MLDDIANAETPEDKAKAAAIYRIWATGKGVSDDTIDNDISTVIDLSGVKAVRNVNEVTPENVATIVASSREEALKLAAAKPSEGNRQASVPEQNAVVASADDLFAGIVTQHPAEIVQPSQTVTPVTYEVASADDLFADFGQLTPNTPNADGASKDNTRILT